MSSGASLAERGREFFDRNPRLLEACEECAARINASGRDVSARQLLEFTRMGRHYGASDMHAMVDIFDTFEVLGNDDYRIPNVASAWLTRHLESKGYRVAKARSKMDENDG